MFGVEAAYTLIWDEDRNERRHDEKPDRLARQRHDVHINAMTHAATHIYSAPYHHDRSSAAIRRRIIQAEPFFREYLVAVLRERGTNSRRGGYFRTNDTRKFPVTWLLPARTWTKTRVDFYARLSSVFVPRTHKSSGNLAGVPLGVRDQHAHAHLKPS